MSWLPSNRAAFKLEHTREIVEILRQHLMLCPTNIWHTVKTKNLMIAIYNWQSTMLLGRGKFHFWVDLLCVNKGRLQELQVAQKETLCLNRRKCQAQSNLIDGQLLVSDWNINHSSRTREQEQLIHIDTAGSTSPTEAEIHLTCGSCREYNCWRYK
jgi:hypothetical protein